jgi:DNA polymerase III sliding clamp (beta) subunit (PCNA family)
MKIKLKDLKRAISVMSVAIPMRSTLPSTLNMYISASDGVCTMRGVDTGNGIYATIVVDCDGDIEPVLVEFDRLKRFVSTLKLDVVIAFNDNRSKLVVVSGTTSASLSVYKDVDDLPGQIRPRGDEFAGEISGKLLREIASRLPVSSNADIELTSIVHFGNGACSSINGPGNPSMVGFMDNVGITGSASPPARTIGSIGKLFDKEDVIRVYISNAAIVFESDDIVISSAQSCRALPDLSKLAYADAPYSFTVFTETLKAVLSRAILFTDDYALVSLTDGVVRVTTYGNEFTEDIEVRSDSDNFEIGVNVPVLLAAVSKLASGEIEFCAYSALNGFRVSDNVSVFILASLTIRD